MYSINSLNTNVKILLEDTSAKAGREDIFKPATGIVSLHRINNDNRDRVVNFSTSKNLTVKSTMFPHRNVYLDISWWKDNQIDYILINMRRLSSVLDVRSFRGADCDTDTT
jgi:hypothetical protein